MNILIIENDLLLASNLKKVFEKKVIVNNIKLHHSYNGFLKEFNLIESYDIIILDIILEYQEKKTGIDIINLIRNKKVNIPIIVISSFSSIEWIQRAFDAGASDYIVKPFRLKEIEIRILKWFKTYLQSLNFSSENKINYQELTYNHNENEFYYDNKKIILTKKSKFLLLIFISMPERLITEELLIIKIWCDNDSFKNRNIRICILRLKKSLIPYGLNNWIHNIRSEGYIFKKGI